MAFRRAGGVGMLAALAALMAGGASARGQDASGPYPRFRDGVAMPPEAAVKGAPFDVAKAFEAPPLEENAAPLYLDALFEFGNELAGCFPNGPETEARRNAVEARNRAFEAVREAFEKDPKSVLSADLDAILAGYAEGFRKLAAAQERPRCVFQTGAGYYALLPHVQAARQVARAASVKVRRELDRGDIDAAIGDVKMVLRLCRDIQPRGYVVNHLVAAAVQRAAGAGMIGPILAAPALKPEHCDRLLAVLAEHDARSLDPFASALQQEYVALRVSLWDAILHQDSLSRSIGIPTRKPYFERLFDRLRGRPRPPSIGETLFQPAQTSTFKKGEVAAPVTPLPEDIDDQLAGTTPEELDRAVLKLNSYYAAVAALKGRPRLEQIANTPDPARFIPGDDVVSIILRECQPSPRLVASLAGRMEATVRAYEALATVRRWQLTHDGASPPDLPSACQAAGLKSVPPDPFDGAPLRLATVEGRPLVYSVGRDGKDDGGRLDSGDDQQPGDLTFRVPVPVAPEKP